MPGEHGNICTRIFRDTWLPEFHKSFGEIFDTPCTRINDPEFMEIVGSHQNFKIEHVEVVNTFEHCDEELRNLLDFGQCSFAECFDFDNAKNVPEEETFYAMGAYIWVMNFLNMSNTIALEDALDQVRSICDSPEPSTNGETDCFELSYVLNILTRGYGFTVSGCVMITSHSTYNYYFRPKLSRILNSCQNMGTLLTGR